MYLVANAFHGNIFHHLFVSSCVNALEVDLNMQHHTKLNIDNIVV